MTLTQHILDHALTLGFDVAAATPITAPRYAAEYADWLAAGRHSEMAYLADRGPVRLDPVRLAPGARSMIVLAVNYNAGPPPVEWDDPRHGRIARYAWSPDYHDVIKPKLYSLDAFIRQQTGRQMLGKACVDTAPLLERDFAEQAGLGFIGRNTCLITPGLGSWTFLSALLVPEVLERRVVHLSSMQNGSWFRSGVGETISLSAAHPGCGACTRCLTACPTNAFAGPHILDARRCISYLTIELRGPIPADLRPLMGNWVFGCDVCQCVCPYNRHAAASAWPTLAPYPAQAAPWLADLLALDDATFRARYRGTPVMRTKRRGLVRNACVAAGNSADRSLIPALTPLLHDSEPLVRGHAAWALGQLDGAEAEDALREVRDMETDAWVGEEIAAVLMESRRHSAREFCRKNNRQHVDTRDPLFVHPGEQE
jgi:epoxyqueuosine reductase